jgi:hypothetical protein
MHSRHLTGHAVDLMALDGRLVESRPAAPRVLARGADSRPIEGLEQFNRATPLLVLDQARWSANPLGMLWPEMPCLADLLERSGLVVLGISPFCAFVLLPNPDIHAA